MADKENAGGQPTVEKKEDGGKKKLSKEERIAARQNQQQQKTEPDEEDFSKGLYGVFPLIQSKDKIDRVLVNVSDLNADLADTKVWIRGRLFVSRQTTSKLLTKYAII